MTIAPSLRFRSNIGGFSSTTPATREYMLRYWAAGFPPTPVSQALGMFWPWDRLMALLGSAQPGDQAAFGYPLPVLYAMLAPAVYPVAAMPPVYLNVHMKRILALVQAERRAGDAIYVYYGAAPVVAFIRRSTDWIAASTPLAGVTAATAGATFRNSTRFVAAPVSGC